MQSDITMIHKDVPRRSRRFADVDRCRLHFVVSWIIKEKKRRKKEHGCKQRLYTNKSRNYFITQL